MLRCVTDLHVLAVKNETFCVFMGMYTRCGSDHSDAWLRVYCCATEHTRAFCDKLIVAS